MPEHAYRCACGQKTRIYYPLGAYPYPEELPCRCGQKLVRFFEGAPAIDPVIWNPYYDQQLGMTITSNSQRRAVLKAKGLDMVSTEEFNRKNKEATPDHEMKWDSQKWKDSAEKAYNDLKYGNVEAPAPPTVDTDDAVVSNPTL